MIRQLSMAICLIAAPFTAACQEVHVTPAQTGMPVRGGAIVVKVADYAAAREQALEAGPQAGGRAGVDEGELLQRRLDLERAARTSTVTVTLYEPGSLPAPQKPKIDIGAWFGRSMGVAWADLQRLFAKASTGAAYSLVFAPLWIP